MNTTNTQGTQVRFHIDAINRGLYGIQPIGSRQFRGPSIAEVTHFETCHCAGPYSPVNVQVPRGVPVWQYIDAEERRWASIRSRQFGNSDAIAKAGRAS